MIIKCIFGASGVFCFAFWLFGPAALYAWLAIAAVMMLWFLCLGAMDTDRPNMAAMPPLRDKQHEAN